MSAVETRQMSAAGTRQMSATEARQMSTIATSVLSQQQTSVLSQHTMLMSQKSQLWQCHNVQVSDRRSGPKSAKMGRNGQDLRIDPLACRGHFQASGTSPAAQICHQGQKIACLGSRAGVILGLAFSSAERMGQSHGSQTARSK